MPHALRVLTIVAAAFAMLLPVAARAQDPDVQALVDRTLFASVDLAVRKRAAERRQVEARAQALEQQGHQQALLLQEQAVTLQRLAGELERLRDEREVIELADKFDAAAAAEDWTSVRAFLAEVISAELLSPARSVLADALVSEWSRAPAPGGVPLRLRSNQRVQLDNNRAVLTFDGELRGRLDRQNRRTPYQKGVYEYHFSRSADGWKIDALRFRVRPS